MDAEQRGIIEFMNRKASRSEELTTIPLETEMTIFVDDPQIRFKTRFTNTAKDHRIRLLVKLITHAQVMILKASMKLLQDQINQQLLGKILENRQHQQAFVSLYDDVKGGR